ncbi:MAG: filamentous hemagglutinin [bacterium]|nr:filamentous hemagglutinin [bacterium]
MSKGLSGLFPGTLGTFVQDIWNTSIVWQHIYITQKNYSGTTLPRSFNIDTPQGKMWTHGNATKHMHQAILSFKDDPRLKFSNPKLYTQFILFDYWKSLSAAVNDGIKYDKMIYSGNWEFLFSKPRKKGDNPVVKHAQFTKILQ